MKGKTDEGLPRSACDYYQRVAAWQPSDGGSQDIFKQLRLNLNHYERRYNQSKERDPHPPKPNKPIKNPSIPLQEKQNCMKLPIIPSLPLKQVKSFKEPFAIKNRNILEDALNPSHPDRTSDRPKLNKALRLTKIRKVRCEQPLDPIGPEFRLDFQRNTESVDKQPVQTERGLKRLSGVRATSQLMDYDFSDACFLPHNRPPMAFPISDEQ